jgi:hypothetical protein
VDIGGGILAVFGFVAIGHNDPDIDTRVNLRNESFCLRLPYSGNAITVGSLTYNQINGDAYGGAAVYKDSVLYAATYG